MNWIQTNLGIRIVGGLGLSFLLYSIWMGQMKAEGLPANYTNPVLALELVAKGDHITQIMNARPAGNTGDSVRDFVKRSTYKDLGFIIVYMMFFAGLGLLLSRLGFSWARPTGYLAALFALLAGVMDLIEDRGMLKAIAGEASDALANSIRYPSLAKWALLFLFGLLVGGLLGARQGLFAVPGALFLISALLGLAGVFWNLFSPRFYWMFPAALGLMGLAVISLTIALMIWPARLFRPSG